jgi:hypothetical protein
MPETDKKLSKDRLRAAVSDEHQPGCFALEEERGGKNSDEFDHAGGRGLAVSGPPPAQIPKATLPAGFCKF